MDNWAYVLLFHVLLVMASVVILTELNASELLVMVLYEWNWIFLMEEGL